MFFIFCAIYTMLKHQGASRTAGTHMAGDAHGRGRVRGMNRSSASEKIEPFSGRLSFSLHFCYFSCVLYGGIEIFRIFANDKGISISTITPSSKNNL